MNDYERRMLEDRIKALEGRAYTLTICVVLQGIAIIISAIF